MTRKTMPDSPARTFERIAGADWPRTTLVHFDRVHLLGGSIGGLLAARVLSGHARHVMILERDPVLAADPFAQREVPHGMQGHNLLAGGNRLLELWFPGLSTGTAP